MSTANRIEELRQKFNENPRRYFAPLANEYRKAGDLEQAIALCREHLPKQPGHMSGYIVFGQALFEAKQMDEAQEVFEQALALDPENLIALRHLGDIALAKSRPSLARRWYERVLDADPRNDDIAAQLVSLAGMSTPRGGLPAIEDVAPPAASPVPPAPSIPQHPAPVVELPPARFTPRSFEPIDLDMPSVRSNPTPSYPPRAIEVPPIPTPDSALRAVDEFPTEPAAPPSHPISDALDAFAAFDPAHALHDEEHDEPLAWSSTADAVERAPEHAAPESVSMSASEAVEFEEGLVAPEWPDTQDLVARMQTPMRSTTPISVPATPDAVEAFGREEHDYLPVAAPGEELLELAAHEDSHEDSHEAHLITDTASDFAPTSSAQESTNTQPEFLAETPVTADASEHSTEHDLDVASFADEFDVPSSTDVSVVAEIPDENAVAEHAESTSHERSDDLYSSFDAPIPRHEISMGLVSSFDEETAQPIEIPSDALGQAASIEIVDEVELQSVDANEVHDESWPVNAESNASVETSLGEPLFADYTPSERVETATPSATPWHFEATPATIADAFADVEAPLAEDVPVAEEASVAEDVSIAAHESIAAEASFADVIDDDMQRMVEASTYGLHNEVAPDVIDVESAGAATSPLSFIESIESMPTPVDYAPPAATPAASAPSIDVPPLATPASFTPISVPTTAEWSPAPVPAAPTPPTPAIGSAAFVTETMAELLVSQGFTTRAVEVYEELVRRRPYDPVLTSRLAELRDVVASQPAPVVVPTPRSVTPVSATTISATPAPSAAINTPAVAVPLYRQTPLSATPVYSTPISATPLSSVAVPGTPLSVPALGHDAEVVERRTARDRFAELARRRVPRRTPPRATASIDEPVDGLASLFGSLPSDPAEDAAARALADAFSTVTEGGPSLFEADLASGDVRATPPGSATYATPPAQRASRGTGAEFSFDRFFPDPASTTGASSAPAPDTASPAHPEAQTGDDHAHFSAWLKGLTKP